MIKKNGFTLVELLAVIALVAIITVLGGFSIIGAQKQIQKDMWNNKKSLIISRAILFAEDNKIYIEKQTCPSFGNKQKCSEITIQTLIDRNYLASTEKNSENKKVFTNDAFDKNDACYYTNDWKVRVYFENDEAYATLVVPANCEVE